MRIMGTEVYGCDNYDEAKAALSFLESKGYHGYMVCHDVHVYGINPVTLQPNKPMLPQYQVFMFEMVEELIQ